MEDVSVEKRTTRRRKPGRPKIPPNIQRSLWVAAGGRCSFPGCNIKVDIDPLTLTPVNHSNIAHIVGASEDGPRGRFALSQPERHQISNLMLLCTKCHKVVDDKGNEDRFPVALLRKHKEDHESRIEYLTGLSASMNTAVVRCRANILSEVVQIPFDHIIEACLPRYPRDRAGIEIDLTRTVGDDSPEYWASKKLEIKQLIDRALSSTIGQAEVEHLSVLALGPMPLLIFLGSCLSNKIPTDLYQRHRDTEKWTWPEDEPPVQFRVECLKTGRDPKKVVVLLMLSGTISLSHLPQDIHDDSTIYCITLEGETPRPTFLRNRTSLANFKIVYREFLSSISAKHPGVEKLHLFPAMPAPFAVLCGRELLQKVDPALVIYDFNKNRGGFEFTLEVNDGCR